METTPGPMADVHELLRAEAAPYVTMPPSPWWVAPAFGAWFAAYVGAFTLWGELRWVFIVAMLLLSAGVIAFLGQLTRRYGALPMPGRGTPPPEIRREYRLYAQGAVAVAGLTVLTGWLLGVAAASAAAFVLVTTGLALYRRRYERAAARTRARLA